METAKIDGAELEYEVSGDDEPVVCIHGAFIADTFRPIASEPALVSGYQLILYHRRGYAGSSRAAGTVGIKQQAADCRALLRHLGVDRAHVVGHSSGGAIALQLALDAPGMVHSLALLEPALMVGASALGYRKSLASDVERSREADAAVAVDAFLQARSPGYRPLLDRMLPGAFTQAVVDAGTVFEHELPGLLDWQFSETEAQRILPPVLSVLGGDSETLWPRFGETHRWLLEQLPNVEAFVLPGTTHFLQVEDPPGMAEALVAFWSSHPIPAPAA